MAEADFLFPAEVMDYLDALHSHGVDLHTWQFQLQDYTQSRIDDPSHKDDRDPSKIGAKVNDELKWLTKQYEPARRLFKKYLDISV